MHLTNYAINKNAENFESNETDSGHKRSLEVVWARLEEEGVNTYQMKWEIDKIITKTVLAVHCDLWNNYRTCQPSDVEGNMCFEILGFDVMIDKDAKPWLIEVNHAPSFNTDTKID